METKQRILDCAMTELERSGAENFSLRAVGAAAGLTPMAVYRHYRDREALLVAVGEAGFAEWAQRIERIRVKPPIACCVHPVAPMSSSHSTLGEIRGLLRHPHQRRTALSGGFRRGPLAGHRQGRRTDRGGAAQRRARRRRSAGARHAVLAQVHGFVMLHRSGRFALARRPFLALIDRSIGRLLQASMSAMLRNWSGALSAVATGILFLLSRDTGPVRRSS